MRAENPCCCEFIFDLEIEDEEYELKFEEDVYDFELGCCIKLMEYRDHYTGSYEVEPQQYDVILPTKDLVMDNDVTVLAVNLGLATYAQIDELFE